MKVVFINKSDSVGGAAVVTLRLMLAMQELGVDARMIVTDRHTRLNEVSIGASTHRIRKAFMYDRLPIFMLNGLNRSRLFQVDAALSGLSLHRHPWVCQADAIALNWINQGVLSLSEIGRIADMGKRMIWTMHDMWCMTGICHHTGKCERFRNSCGVCPLLGTMAGSHDLSAMTWRRKQRLYVGSNISFVAVSNWLAQRATVSSLLSDQDVRVIPNAFPISDDVIQLASIPRPASIDGKTHIIFGAARMDDPIKGFPILIELTRVLAKEYPQVAATLHLDLFGNIRDHSLLSHLLIPYTAHGQISDSARLRTLYAGAKVVLSTSHFETLPGTLVEGQAYGAIPVAFDRGGQADIIDNNRTGYLVKYEDDIHLAASNMVTALIKALQQPDEVIRPLMARDVMRKFGAHSVAQQYIDLINKSI